MVADDGNDNELFSTGGQLTKTKFIGQAARSHEGFLSRLKFEKLTVKKLEMKTVKKTITFPNSLKSYNKGYEL
jgi:hypothetical protein